MPCMSRKYVGACSQRYLTVFLCLQLLARCRATVAVLRSTWGIPHVEPRPRRHEDATSRAIDSQQGRSQGSLQQAITIKGYMTAFWS